MHGENKERILMTKNGEGKFLTSHIIRPRCKTFPRKQDTRYGKHRRVTTQLLKNSRKISPMRVCVWNRAPLQSVGRDCQRRRCLPLQPHCRLCYRSVYVCDSLRHSTRSLSRDSCSHWTAEIIARRFQAHSSTVQNLKEELRDRAVSPCSYHPLALHSRSRQTCSMQTCTTSSVRGDWLGTSQQMGRSFSGRLTPNFRLS